MSTLSRGIAPSQRSTAQLLASLHERLAGTRGVHELADLERRMTMHHPDLRDLLDYVQADEEHDFELNDEPGERHIVHAIRRLRESLGDE